MWIILGVLAAGIIVGTLVKFNERHLKIVQFLQRVGMIILIFSMGIGIGGNKELVRNIQSIGLRSLVFACFTIIFSVALVFVTTKKDSGRGA